MLLSILIATTLDRKEMFSTLYAEFFRQVACKPVEVLFEEDNKEISIGAKRQRLLERATGEYIVFFDSDDFPCPTYVNDILLALSPEHGKEKPDCVGFLIHMTTNGTKPQVCCHSLRHKQWAKNVDGYDYVRNVTHFNVAKREIALQVGFKDLRFGEDKEYADRLTALCKTEVFINKKLFHYRYRTEPHNQKYSIK